MTKPFYVEIAYPGSLIEFLHRDTIKHHCPCFCDGASAQDAAYAYVKSLLTIAYNNNQYGALVWVRVSEYDGICRISRQTVRVAINAKEMLGCDANAHDWQILNSPVEDLLISHHAPCSVYRRALIYAKRNVVRHELSTDNTVWYTINYQPADIAHNTQLIPDTI